jgi:predicted nucleic acid-binding protein
VSDLRVNVETTVWSFVFAEDSPDYTSDTLRFFDACRAGRFETLIGPAVIDEIARAPLGLRENLAGLLKEIRPTIATMSVEAEALGDAFLRLGAVPPSKPDDASHVAYAFVAQADVLVSWNFKHIANIRRAEKFNAIASLRGFRKPLTITTPSEVLYGEDQA